MRTVGVLLTGYAVAVALAAVFSGSVLAPIFACPVAVTTGILAALKYTTKGW